VLAEPSDPRLKEEESIVAFLTDEQRSLAEEVARVLTDHSETVSVAEGTTGGLVSAALLSVAGASRYFAGGGVVYTLNSRVQLAGVDPRTLENYQGTTPDMVLDLAEKMRDRLGSTWSIAESGLAGPTGGRSGAAPGLTRISIAGPLSRVEVYETGSADREANMVEFTTLALLLFRDVIKDRVETA
jgi:PncC family amidohydrolase